MKWYENCILKDSSILNADVVYRSRAVMRLYDDTTFYDDALICYDADLCDQVGYTYKVAQAKPIKQEIECTLYPNPAKDVSTLKFSQIPIGMVTCIITDIQGREVYRYEKP